MKIDELDNINKIRNIIRSKRFIFNGEKHLQVTLNNVFLPVFPQTKREVYLGKMKDIGDLDLGIIDFMIDDIGVEIKIKGSPLEIFRQIERYALHPSINHVVLITNVTMTLPETVNGKPAHIIYLNR